MAAGRPIPELSDGMADETLDMAQRFAADAFRWGRRHFPGDDDAAMALAMSMLVQATGHAAAQCIGVTTETARIGAGAAMAGEQVTESTTTQHAFLMRARAAAG
jgi:hypothetical protein